MNNSGLNAYTNKTFLRLSDIYDKFNTVESNYCKQIPEKSSIHELYTLSEIKEKYNVKERWIYEVIRNEKIPKISKRGKSYYSKKHIDQVFANKKTDTTITEWYSVEELQEEFNMTATAIYSFVYENKIPKKKEGRKVYYSKKHFGIAKGIIEPEELQYYTSKEAMQKYNLTQDALYHYVKYHNIPKVKEGRYIKISKKHIDEIFKQPIIL